MIVLIIFYFQARVFKEPGQKANLNKSTLSLLANDSNVNLSLPSLWQPSYRMSATKSALLVWIQKLVFIEL